MTQININRYLTNVEVFGETHIIDILKFYDEKIDVKFLIISAMSRFLKNNNNNVFLHSVRIFFTIE